MRACHSASETLPFSDRCSAMSMATPEWVQAGKHAASVAAGLPRRIPRARSFADAKPRKDPPEQIVGAELARNLAQTLCRQTQFLSKKIELTIALCRMLVRNDQVLVRCLQRLQQ